MSLKFGIYLVEQRIVSPEQFCGLVKIQQETVASLATIAIRKNMMTIKQVASVLDEQELTPSKSFVQLAIELDYLDRADAEQLVKEQQHTSPTIRKLVQECGLLTERQCNVLFQHYQRTGTRPISRSGQTRREQSSTKIDRPTTPTTTVPTETTTTTGAMRPKAPKFKQKPVIVSPYTSPATG